MDATHQALLEGIKQRRRLRGVSDTPGAFVAARDSSYLSPHNSPPRVASASPQREKTPAVQPPRIFLGVVTAQNPYRAQSYFDFRVNPDQSSAAPGKKQSTGLREYIAQQAPAQEMPSTAPAFHLETSIQVLKAGDWFLKWNGRKSEVHRRYVYLCPKALTLHWSKAENGNAYLSGGFTLVDVVHVEGAVLLWDERAGDVMDVRQQPRRSVPVYVMRIFTKEYQLQLGTERRDKYDLWFDAVNRLTKQTREYQKQHHGRVGDKPWDSVDVVGFPQNTDPTE